MKFVYDSQQNQFINLNVSQIPYSMDLPLFGQLLPFSFIFDVNELIFFPTFLIDEIVAYDPMS